MQRRAIWEENKRMIEDNNRGFLMGRRPFTMVMNKYGDLVRSSVFVSTLKPPLSHTKLHFKGILSKYNAVS